MRIWLTGMTSKGHEKDLKELIEPIKNDFNGLVWVFHYPLDSGYDYLDSVKAKGEIIKTKWCNRFDFSRNHCLFQGPMKVGDWFLVIDTLERLSPVFTNKLSDFCKHLDKSEVDGVYLYNKRFLFKLKEQTRFVNNPHEGIAGSSRTIELSKQNFWNKEYKKNVRSEIRQDPYHFIEHNFKYYFLPNTNHLLLGFEDDPELVQKRYENRSKLIQEIYTEGFDPFNIDSVKECFRTYLTDRIKEYIDFDKFLNDWYRFNILEEKEGIVDKHDFSLFKPIFK